MLAAGRGQRMRSDQAKVLHRLGGRTLVEWVLDALSPVVDRVVVVVGHQQHAVRDALGTRSVEFVVQAEQLGTGHAVATALPALAHAETCLVVAGDVPLLTAPTLARVLDRHRERGAAATVLGFEAADPHGYGRLVRGRDGDLDAIVEQAQSGPAEAALREVNSGTLALALPIVAPLLPALPRRPSGEVQLTDLVAALRAAGHAVATVMTSEAEAAGINTPEQLAAAEIRVQASGADA